MARPGSEAWLAEKLMTHHSQPMTSALRLLFFLFPSFHPGGNDLVMQDIHSQLIKERRVAMQLNMPLFFFPFFLVFCSVDKAMPASSVLHRQVGPGGVRLIILFFLSAYGISL